MDALDILKEFLKTDAAWACVLGIWGVVALKVVVPMAPVLAERWKGQAVAKLNGNLSEQIRYAMEPFASKVRQLEDWRKTHSAEIVAREARLTTVIADVKNLTERDNELRDDIATLRSEVHTNHVDLTEAIGAQAEKTTKAVAESYRAIVNEIQTAMRRL